jgi:magnesium chelatase family protein
MGLGVLSTRATTGIDAPIVKVEVQLANGIPAFLLVGLAETAVKEARERVRGALITSGFDFPARRITVNLAPADIPKTGGRYDLPIALGILVAGGILNDGQFAAIEFAGELGLNGDICYVQGILPMAIACQRHQQTLMLPASNEAEIQLVNGLNYICANTLLEVYLHFSGQQPLPVKKVNTSNLAPHIPLPKWDDILGQEQAKRALAIAAVGSHNLLMLGPPGTGKSLLASRLLNLLPPMTTTEALEVAALKSVKGESISKDSWLCRPLRSPHHTSSAVALTGGGTHPRPGEVSLAHHGVLFLDELPEFGRKTLDVLREPLETGDISIARAAATIAYPANFQLLAALNPSPTGDVHDGRTSPDQILQYLNRLSGPLLDRIDLQVEVPATKDYGFATPVKGPDSAIAVAKDIAQARQRQLSRQGKLNAQLNVDEMLVHCQLSQENLGFLQNAATTLKLSMRVFHRTIKVARSIADYMGDAQIEQRHIAEALGYRALDNLIRQLSSN